MTTHWHVRILTSSLGLLLLLLEVLVVGHLLVLLVGHVLLRVHAGSGARRHGRGRLGADVGGRVDFVGRLAGHLAGHVGRIDTILGAACGFGGVQAGLQNS